MGYGVANVDYAFNDGTWQIAVNTLKTTKRSIGGVMLMLLALYLFHAQTNVISISQELIFWLVLGFALQSKHLES